MVKSWLSKNVEWMVGWRMARLNRRRQAPPLPRRPAHYLGSRAKCGAHFDLWPSPALRIGPTFPPAQCNARQHKCTKCAAMRARSRRQKEARCAGARWPGAVSAPENWKIAKTGKLWVWSQANRNATIPVLTIFLKNCQYNISSKNVPIFNSNCFLILFLFCLDSKKFFAQIPFFLTAEAPSH